MKDSQVSLEVQLSRFFDIHLSRLKCLCGFVLSLIQLRTVNLSELSLCLNTSVSPSSNYKRLQRFVRLFRFPEGVLARFLWHLYEEDEIPLLSIDRSNWKFGRKNINILMLSLCHRGMGIPILWTVLKDKRGNSSTKERIELLERFFRIIEPPGIIRLLGDREFIGEKWLDWLDSHYVHFVIRIRANQQVLHQGRKEVAAKQLFDSENWISRRKPRPVSGYLCYIGG